MYSAVKVRGRPLYKYARKGEAIERSARRVLVKEFEVLNVESPVLEFRVVCGSGTYIRTLVHDLGERLGVGAHLSALTRTRVGRFSVEHAVAPDVVTQDSIISVEEALLPMPAAFLEEPIAERARHGNPISIDVPGAELIALKNASGVFAVARLRGGAWWPETVVPT
jgi:tRNA pseudouridine55 synthase